jgi:hypothetical protein
MPARSKKSEGKTLTAEGPKKAGEDLERTARDFEKRMSESEQEKRRSRAVTRERAHGTQKHSETKPEARGAKAGRKEVVGRKKAPESQEVPRGSKPVNSVDEHEDHLGQSLATRNHEVIMRWAEERNAQPATVEGTEHEGRPGVLRFDFPGYGGGVKAISWEEWFKTFDARELTFLYQEHLKNGNQSNFFRLTNPHREDG